MHEITQILSAIEQGDLQAAEQLLPLVYEELRKLAAQKLAHEKLDQTLQPTDLVHEAYLRLVDADKIQQWNGRGHFFAAAAEAMRRILVERARHKHRLRHGGGRQRLNVDDLDLAAAADDDRLLALDEALEQFTAEEPRGAQVIKLHYFAGLKIEQLAETLGIATRTVKRDLAYGKARLQQLVSQEGRADE